MLRTTSFRLLAAAAILSAAACGPKRPGPFYAEPAPRGASRPGDLIRTQKMSGSPAGSKAWKIVYLSTGLDGQPIEVSGVVIAPDLPKPIAGRPVVAWAHGTTGVSPRCAPSDFDTYFETIPHLPALITLDYVVVTTDYPGLGTAGPHPYLVGISEGRAVLDAVRAAGAIEEAGAGRRFTAWGHSQGGHAALFTGQLARSYAPELTLAGVAAIAPATDLATLLRDDLAERAGKVIASYCLWAWSRVYDAPLEPAVVASAVPVIDRMARDCVESRGEAYVVAFESLGLPGTILAEGAMESEPWKRLLVENTPGGSPIGVPIYVAQGTEDVIVRPSVTADYVARLCRAGETVELDELPGAGHMRAGHVSATRAIQWMRARLEGGAPPQGCARR